MCCLNFERDLNTLYTTPPALNSRIHSCLYLHSASLLSSNTIAVICGHNMIALAVLYKYARQIAVCVSIRATSCALCGRATQSLEICEQFTASCSTYRCVCVCRMTTLYALAEKYCKGRNLWAVRQREYVRLCRVQRVEGSGGLDTRGQSVINVLWWW